MKTATSKTKGAMVKAELKTIRTIDIDTSARLPWWCCWSDKLSVLFEPSHRWRTYSQFPNVIHW